jgi:hypothetical protein
MKKKVPEKLKALVIDSVRRHAWNIGVSHYTGDILYMDEDKGGERDGYVYADMTTDRRYLKATLKIYPKCIKEWEERGDDFIESIIAHEGLQVVNHDN